MPTTTTTETTTAGGLTTTKTTTATVAAAEDHAPGPAAAAADARAVCLGYTMESDPRMDPRVVAPFAALGMAGAPAPCALTRDSSREEILASTMASEWFMSGDAAMAGFKPVKAEIERSEETIKGAAGQDMTLFIHKPKGATGALPCVYHMHGGGMATGHARDPIYFYLRDAMAAEGLIVVGVEFTNCAGADGLNVFPAGLDDCSAGLKWTAENKDKLGISKIIVAGESGGGNLSISTTMANKALVDGTYAMCPYIAGDSSHPDAAICFPPPAHTHTHARAVTRVPTGQGGNGCQTFPVTAYRHWLGDLHYEKPPPELKSLIENDGIFLSTAGLSVSGMLYTDGDNATNPLAWPYYATAADLQGMPPITISVNECDPLRDEGVAFGKKLVEAGVEAMTRCVMGTSHGGDLFCGRGPIQDATMRDIKAFAESL